MWGINILQECGITGRQITYSQLIDGALRWASCIEKSLPNDPNPTIAFLMPNSPENVVAFFGCMAHGATVSPINPLYTPRKS